MKFLFEINETKSAELKMSGTGWRRFSLAGCSFASRSSCGQEKRGKRAVWWGQRKIVGLTGRRVLHEHKWVGLFFPLRKAPGVQ